MDRPRGGPQIIPRPPVVRAGPPAPWAHLPESQRRPTLVTVRAALGAAPDPLRMPAQPAAGASAVLAAVHAGHGEAEILLTRRAWHLRQHRGEISFPGGRQEPGESLWETAVREAVEEVALDPTLVRPLGEHDHLRTVTSSARIVPFVAELTDRPVLRPEPGEVEAVRHVPLAELLAEGVYREEQWEIDGVFRPIFFFEIEGDTIWGATAAMLRNLMVLVTGTFDPEDRPTPWRGPTGTRQ